MQGQAKSPTLRRRARAPSAVHQATAAPPEHVKPSLIEQFHVAVDRQLKSGHGTYEAAEKAALAIKARHPHLQVTVYDAKEQRHTTVEQPGAATNPHKEPSHHAGRNDASTPRRDGGRL